jgi:hypothetical protein
MDCRDVHQNPLGSFSGEVEKYIFLWSIFHMHGHLMKQAHLHQFSPEINSLAPGLPWASELLDGVSSFIKHNEQKQSSRIIRQCLLQCLLGGESE